MKILLTIPGLPHERFLLRNFVSLHPTIPGNWKIWAQRYRASPRTYDEVIAIIHKYIMQVKEFDAIYKIAMGIQELRDFSKYEILAP